MPRGLPPRACVSFPWKGWRRHRQPLGAWAAHEHTSCFSRSKRQQNNVKGIAVTRRRGCVKGWRRECVCRHKHPVRGCWHATKQS
eukprot:5239343-Heterocapsa_arctica.AAC.1